ncbi:MAG: MazG-like family protein [Alicyclobacillus sp.]|nr:MazG-like family protein [Alicyclobacillus sp.]
MPQMDPHVQIARKIRSVESVKVHLLSQLADVFKTVQAGSEAEMAESIGGMVGLCYYLARQLGLDLRLVDEQAQHAWMASLNGKEADPGDMEFVRKYLRSLR